MSKEVRLLQDGATELEALLLKSGRDDAPPDPVERARAIENIKTASQAAIWVGGGILGSRWLASGWSILPKVIACGGLGVALTVGIVELAAPRSPAPAAPSAVQRPPAPVSNPIAPAAPSVVSDPAPTPRITAQKPVASADKEIAVKEVVTPVHAVPREESKPARVAAVTAPKEAEPAPAPASPSLAPRELVGSLRDETAKLQAVRQLVDASQADRALAALDQYDASYGKGMLAEEAAVLRVEALLLAGNRTEARRSVELFERRHPTSSYLPRVRALVENKEEKKEENKAQKQKKE